MKKLLTITVLFTVGLCFAQGEITSSSTADELYGQVIDSEEMTVSQLKRSFGISDVKAFSTNSRSGKSCYISKEIGTTTNLKAGASKLHQKDSFSRSSILDKVFIEFSMEKMVEFLQNFNDSDIIKLEVREKKYEGTNIHKVSFTGKPASSKMNANLRTMNYRSDEITLEKGLPPCPPYCRDNY